MRYQDRVAGYGLGREDIVNGFLDDWEEGELRSHEAVSLLDSTVVAHEALRLDRSGLSLETRRVRSRFRSEAFRSLRSHGATEFAALFQMSDRLWQDFADAGYVALRMRE